MLEQIKKNKPLAAILFVSVLLRIGAAVYLGNEVADLPGIADQLSYQDLAERVVGGYGFTHATLWWPWTRANEPTAHWSYLYTLYLAGVYALVGVRPIVARLLQAIVTGVLHPWLAHRLGRRLFGERVGLVAAGATAVYIYFIYYAGALMTEAFYLTVILWGLEISFSMVSAPFGSAQGKSGEPGTRPHWLGRALGLGVLLGVTLLLRQVYLLFIPFLFIWILTAGGKRQFRSLVVAGAVMVCAILPATLFNYRQFDRFVLLNTNAGFAFFWGNHPIYGTHFVPILPGQGAYQKLIPEEVRVLDEAAMDQELLRRGIGFVTADPWRYVLLSLSRIPAYFQFGYAAKSGLVSNISRIGSFGVFLPFMIWGLIKGWSRRWDSPGFVLVLFAVVYSGVHLLTWALVRYRLPVDAVLLVFAACALAGLWDAWRNRRARRAR